MHKGLNRVTLGVVCVALLSGSIFAAGPTLINLPTVVITDRHQEDDLPLLGLNVYDFERTATQNTYRFTEAFDLQEYVSYGGDINTVRYLFTEFDETGTTLQTGTNRTISINSQLGEEAIPGYAEVSVGPLAGPLTFQNDYRDGSDPGGLFTDTALLDMYVASDEAGQTDIDVKTFTVVTTNDPAEASAPGNPLGDYLQYSVVPVFCPDQFGYYNVQKFDVIWDFAAGPPVPWPYPSPPPTPNGYASNTPPSSTTPTTVYTGGVADVDVATSPAPTLDITTYASSGSDPYFAPQYWAWQSYRKDIPESQSFSVDEGMLYMVRWTLSGDADLTPADSALVPGLRFRVGSPTTFGVGQQKDEMNSPGANAITGGATTTHRSWYYANKSSEIGLYFDQLQLYDTTTWIGNPHGAVDCTMTLEGVEVFRYGAPDDCLTSPIVMLNQGAASFTYIGDDPTSLSLAPFDTAAWEARTPVQYLARGLTGSITTDMISWDLAAGDGAVYGEMDTSPYAIANGNEIVPDVPTTRLIRLDAWLSSPQGSTADNLLPIMRVGIQSNAFGESGVLDPFTMQGRVAYLEWYASNRTGNDVGILISPVQALQTSAQRYSVFLEPDIRAVGASTLSVRPTMDIYSFPLWSSSETGMSAAIHEDPYQNGTIRCHRMVITTYELPATADTVACP